MLDPLIILFTEQGLSLEVLIFKIDISQNVVSFDYFIQNVEVERQLINGLDLLHKFPTDGKSNPKVKLSCRMEMHWVQKVCPQ